MNSVKLNKCFYASSRQYLAGFRTEKLIFTNMSFSKATKYSCKCKNDNAVFNIYFLLLSFVFTVSPTLNATTGEAVRLTFSADRKQIASDDVDLAFITLKVEDVNGLMVPRSHPSVNFEIEGPGEIVATDNSDATSFVSFQSHRRPVYNGMALVIVKAKKGKSGNIRITAKSEDLLMASTEVKIK